MQDVLAVLTKLQVGAFYTLLTMKRFTLPCMLITSNAVHVALTCIQSRYHRVKDQIKHKKEHDMKWNCDSGASRFKSGLDLRKHD
jgi:hypothetical protein